ncbi:DUF2391 family protein [Candidatus Woesearchaeota archaeon]|nr:DUF2391 family protein [Candidatus Woesearchaeota archaeon]
MPKKKTTQKKTNKRNVSKPNLNKIDDKLDKILKYEKEQNKSDDILERLGKRQIKQDDEFEKNIDELQEHLEKNVGSHPLKKITYRDFGKSLIGAFIGVVSHFAFLEGAHLSEGLSIMRATILLVTAYVLGMIFIYVAGFRKVKNIKLFGFIPARITVIYFVSLAVVYFVLFIFGLTEHATITEIYKQVAAVSIPAIIGASAADLIGKNE